MKIKVKCDWCMRGIFKSRYSLRINKHHFCNNTCCSLFKAGRDAYGKKVKKIKINCSWCNKTLQRFLSRINNKKHFFCNKKHMGLWLKHNIIGKKHHGFCKKEIKCDYCNKIILRSKWWLKNNKHNFCDSLCFGKGYKKYYSNKNSPMYVNGESRTPYSLEFSYPLKEFIRKRDKYLCQNQDCGVPQKECIRKLDVHHIDYNKKNNDPINLIALCYKCNTKANFNRKYWQNYYEEIQIKRRVHELEKYVI